MDVVSLSLILTMKIQQIPKTYRQSKVAEDTNMKKNR